jgi:hypothetical protein
MEIDVKKIEKVLKEQGFFIYPTTSGLEEFPRIVWEGDNWEDFITIAKSEGIKTMFLKKEIFKKEHIDSNLVHAKDSDEKINEFNAKIKSFSKYINKVAIFTIYWIKDDLIYSFTKTSKWAEEFLDISVEVKDSENREFIGM